MRAWVGVWVCGVRCGCAVCVCGVCGCAGVRGGVGVAADVGVGPGEGEKGELFQVCWGGWVQQRFVEHIISVVDASVILQRQVAAFL